MSAPLSAEREREIRRMVSAFPHCATGDELRGGVRDLLAALDHARAELAAASQPCAECGAPSPRAQNRPA